MLTTRIEFDGAAGHLTIEKKPGSSTIRIDSIIRNPTQKQQAWKTWELSIASHDDDLFTLAIELHQRTEGGRGTNSMVNDLFRELQRFQD